MRTMMRAVAVAAVIGGVLFVAGCGDDDDTSGADAAGTVDDGASQSGDDTGTETTAGDTGEASSGGGGAGTLVFAGEEIALGPGRCYLQEQPAAAGGGSILATAQASGTTAAGDPVNIDFTRYSEDSQFAGDDVTVDVGPLGQSESHAGRAPEGTVSIDGGTVSATDFPVDGTDTISFSIDCG